MKPANSILSVLIGCLAMIASQAQNQSGIDSTGLPGDNFSLQGALEMFKKAGSPEEFEKLINTKNNSVNNLDLNGDGEIDYVRVIDKSEKDLHAFVLQVPVSEKESQDIAVVELEKTGDANAIVQIIGDEDIYGEAVIVEPDSEANDQAYNYVPDYTTSKASWAGSYNPRIVINVWHWPAVRFVYGPGYMIWRSPWRWRHYPGWWSPWRPLAWRVYHPMRVHYHRPFVIVRTHRVIHAHRIYAPVRVSSVTVRTRHSASVNHYRVTRTRTTVTGPRGNQVSRKTTTVRGKGGQVKNSRTTIKKRR
jgi:hypothetical protein